MQSISQSQRVFADINQLSAQTQIDEFTLARLKSEATKLVEPHPISGYSALGLIASLERDVEAIRENFSKALEAASDNLAVLNNYAVALSNVGLIYEAADCFSDIQKFSEHDLPILNNAIKLHHSIGKVYRASKLVNLWNKYNPDHAHELSPTVEALTAFMDENQVKEHHIILMIKTALQLLEQHQVAISPKKIHPMFVENESSKCFQYHIDIQVSMQRLTALDIAYADALAETDLTANVAMNFMVSFEKLESMIF